MTTATKHKEIPLIVIVGQTASGKSGLALQVAQEYDGEIICADSRTVYRDMDVGTAKPSARDQQQVAHHGLDLVDPNQTFTAGQFKDYALKTIADIRARSRLPIMVGGTGLYINGVLFDYSFVESNDSRKRRLLNNMSLEKLQSEALKTDPHLSKSTLHNTRHLIGIIERQGTPKNNMNKPDNTLIIGISPSRNIFRNNIEQRVELMFADGLRREVDDLVGKYGWECEAMTGIGYREFRPYYNGEVSMSKVKKDIVQNTLQLAKRQRTWFKRNPYIEWFESAKDANTLIADFIAQSGYTKS